MTPTYKEQFPKPVDSYQMGASILMQESFPSWKGRFIFHMVDSSGAVVAHFEQDNIITADGGIVAARLFKNSQEPVPGRANGILMLAVGSGATGNILSPNVPQRTQRKLNTEIARKSFSSTQFRNQSGIAVAIPTNIVDFTTTFNESEAVGALNEMALMSPYSSNPLVKNPINNGPSNYDPTIDVSAKDLLCNYTTFPVVSKIVGMVLTLTWRLTF